MQSYKARIHYPAHGLQGDLYVMAENHEQAIIISAEMTIEQLLAHTVNLKPHESIFKRIDVIIKGFSLEFAFDRVPLHEAWKVIGGADSVFDLKTEFGELYGFSQSEAQRIAAAMNSVNGVPTDVLEKVSMADTIDTLNMLREIEHEENSRLRGALKNLISLEKTFEQSDGRLGMFDHARNALNGTA